MIIDTKKGRLGAVVRVVSLSYQVVGSKQPLRRFEGGRLASVFPSPDPIHVGASGTGSVEAVKTLTSVFDQTLGHFVTERGVGASDPADVAA